MRFTRDRVFLASAVALIVVTSQSMMLADPGFGLVKKRQLTLKVRRPALVRLANTSIGFSGSATDKEYGPVLGSLEATLETELVGNEKSLIKKPKPEEADWVLKLTVTGFSVPPPTHRVDSTQKSRTTFTRWSGSLNVAYQVVDKVGRVHDADNVSYSYNKEFDSTEATNTTSRFGIPGLGGGAKSSGPTPRSAEDVKQILVREVVVRIASNLGNTVQMIEVPVATGDDHLNRVADFFERGLWARAIEELEKTPEYAKPDAEAYRQYDLGLAYEGVSYEASTYNDQRANLFKAQEYYDKATDSNRGEKRFVDAVARTRESVARYKALEAMQKADPKKPAAEVNAAQANKAAPAAPAAPARPEPGGAPAKTTTVDDVIEMLAAGVPEGHVIDIIRGSNVVFDPLDKDTAIKMSKAKIPIGVQNEMRKKVGLAPLAPARAAAPATPPRPSSSSAK